MLPQAGGGGHFPQVAVKRELHEVCSPWRTKSAAVPTNQGTREDTPGEDAMKLQKILFSFDGRIGRRTYWLAILALIVAVQVLTFAPCTAPTRRNS